MEIMATFSPKLKRRKFDINVYIYIYIYISCEEGDKNKKDECIFLNRQLRALVLKIILFFMIKSILDRSWDSEMNLRISIQVNICRRIEAFDSFSLNETRNSSFLF